MAQELEHLQNQKYLLLFRHEVLEYIYNSYIIKQSSQFPLQHQKSDEITILENSTFQTPMLNSE